MQANNLNAVGVNPMYPQSGIAPMTTMNNPNNIPVSNDILRKSNIYDPYTGSQRLATGGIAQGIGGYSDGGQLLKGPGDGMSDDIPAKIGEHQPARLADGEFVVPADVVSHLGNGSTDAGAKQLYAMLDRVRKARTGNHKQGKQIKAQKFLPK
jgi:hypothetical protein